MTSPPPRYTPGSTDLAIIIVNWNASEDLEQCLGSMVAAPPSRPWEVILVDNQSTDGSLEMVRRRFPWVTLVENNPRRSLAAANNQGLLASRAELVVISNPDVLYPVGALDAFCDLLERHPAAAFGVARLRQTDGNLQSSAGNLPSLGEAVLGRQVQRVLGGPSRMSGFCWDGWAHDQEIRVGRAGDASYIGRRSAIAAVGLFDERFPLDWEAIDLSARVTQAGWEIWFSPRVEVVHLGGGSTGRAPTMRLVAETHRSMYRYFANRTPRWAHPALYGLFASRAVVKVAATRLGVRFRGPTGASRFSKRRQG